jgi:glycosyltransferase involved in cell wall biosynthesis
MKDSQSYRLCYISKNYYGTAGSGNKAKTDNEKTLAAMGAHNLGMRQTLHRNKILAFFLDLAGIIKFSCTAQRGDVVVLQYPIKKYFAFICDMARSARSQDRDADTRPGIVSPQETHRGERDCPTLAHRLRDSVQRGDAAVARRQGIQERARRAGTFRLPLIHPNQSATHTPSARRRIVYAGALAMRKNAFILHLPDVIENYELHIYGNRDGLHGLRDSDRIIFHGFAPADEFISSVDADFGLVWDGDSLDSCTGNFGEYLRYNSPHKVSFYLRAGLPVIIWRGAALAGIVESEGIGICIDSMHEINDLLARITDEEMQTMKNNVRRVSDRLKSGGYLKAAVNKALEEI